MSGPGAGGTATWTPQAYRSRVTGFILVETVGEQCFCEVAMFNGNLWVPFGAAEVGCGWPVVGLHAQLSVYGKENHLSTADSWALRGSVKETDRR